jgi:hypothetical protein
MFALLNNANNSLRFAQVYIGANDMKWLLIQRTNNVDNTIFNFRNGNIAVGTFSNPAYRIDLVGDINITGNYRVNSTIYKPANAVLADTASVATKLATARTIAGTSFDGTANINIDYFALNNKPIILQPTTTNLQLTSGYTFAVPGNVSIGTTAIATNVLQVGAGGRLRISNGATDYSMIGTIDTDGSTNTKIIISGNTRSANAGNIQYLATASSGSHIFYTSPTTTTRMTISSAGVNINDDLGVTGNVGIGTAPSATYKVNVNGTLNATSVLVNGSAITGSKWTTGTPTTDICYSAGNVNIGTTTSQSSHKLNVNGNAYVANQLVFNNSYNGGGADYACNKISLYGGGNTPTTTAGQYGFGISGSTLDYFTSAVHRFRYSSATGGTNFGSIGMELNNNNLNVGNNITVNNIVGTSYLLANGYVISRNGYDAVLYTDSGGMRMSFGDSGTGNSTYLEISANNGTTNFNSGAARDIFFRNNGYRWLFQNNGWSWNGLNTSVWTSFSDHRIKENIKKANLQTCYENVKNINLYRYNYIDGFSKGVKHDKTQLGYIAQQVYQHFPKSVSRTKTRIEDKREIPDLCGIDTGQINYTLFGAVKQLMKVVEKQSKRIKKLEEQLGIVDDDDVENDADEPYERIVCDEVDINTIEPSEPEGV